MTTTAFTRSWGSVWRRRRRPPSPLPPPGLSCTPGLVCCCCSLGLISPPVLRPRGRPSFDSASCEAFSLAVERLPNCSRSLGFSREGRAPPPLPPVERGSGGTGGANNNPLIGITLRPPAPRICSGSAREGRLQPRPGSLEGRRCMFSWRRRGGRVQIGAIGCVIPSSWRRRVASLRQNPAHERLAAPPGSAVLPRAFRLG